MNLSNPAFEIMFCGEKGSLSATAGRLYLFTRMRMVISKEALKRGKVGELLSPASGNTNKLGSPLF